jgi:hypothetical protein
MSGVCSSNEKTRGYGFLHLAAASALRWCTGQFPCRKTGALRLPPDRIAVAAERSMEYTALSIGCNARLALLTALGITARFTARPGCMARRTLRGTSNLEKKPICTPIDQTRRLLSLRTPPPRQDKARQPRRAIYRPQLSSADGSAVDPQPSLASLSGRTGPHSRRHECGERGLTVYAVWRVRPFRVCRMELSQVN